MIENNNQRKKNPAAFLRNLFQILQNPDYHQVICWVPVTQNGFIIKNLQQFQTEILPQFFKHKKFSSFVRQLNMYGFHKKRNSTFDNCFLHEQFKRGDELPTDIKRKPQKKKKGTTNEQENAENISESHQKNHSFLKNNEDNENKHVSWMSVEKDIILNYPQIASKLQIESDCSIKNKYNQKIVKNYVIQSFPMIQERKQNITFNNSVQDEQNIKIQGQIHALSYNSDDSQYPSRINLGEYQNQNSMIKQQNIPNQFRNINQINLKQYQQMKLIQNNSTNSRQYQCDLKQNIYHDRKNKQQQEQKNNINKLTQLNIISQVQTYTSKFISLNSMNLIQNWHNISSLLMKQNSILRNTNQIIRQVVLNSQKNKINYLNQQLKQQEYQLNQTQLDQRKSMEQEEQEQVKKYNQEKNQISSQKIKKQIIKAQLSQLQYLIQTLQKQIYTISQIQQLNSNAQIQNNSHQNLKSTTSIILNLQRC